MFFIKSWFSSWTALGTLLGPSRHPLGTLLGLSWGALGRSWTLLGHFLAAPGRLKSAQEAAGVRTGRAKKRKKTDFSLSCCFWAALGPVLAPLGLILGPPGLILRALGQYFGLSMGFPGRFPPTFLAKLLHQVSRNVCGNFSVGLRHRFAGN